MQLFNAVQKHQKNVDEKVREAGGSIRKRAKLLSAVSRKDFISVLRGTDGSTGGRSSPGTNAEAKQVRLLRGVSALGVEGFGVKMHTAELRFCQTLLEVLHALSLI